MSQTEYPFAAFRFQVEFARNTSGGSPAEEIALCRGGFSECTGLEATMEPKVIKEGGRNYGATQRVGPVTFATVILKRGMTSGRDLWTWFSHVNLSGRSAFRLDVTITVLPSGEADTEPALRVHLARALPVKFKCADLSARATEVAVEELHLVHEGLSFE